MRRYTDDQLINAVPRCISMSQLMRELGYAPAGGMREFLRQDIKRLSLDTSHWKGMAHGTTHYIKYGLTLDEILVKDSPVRVNLKKRLLTAGLKEAKCEVCGITEWLGQPAPLEVDHINGDKWDNRIENLRIICPNCHAQTPTYKSKNRRSYEGP